MLAKFGFFFSQITENDTYLCMNLTILFLNHASLIFDNCLWITAGRTSKRKQNRRGSRDARYFFSESS
ncbi:unnamed protein product, partial [Brassica rapa subsp. trilocularis]